MDDRQPQPVHDDEGATSPAPGELELVRSFLSLHDHAAADGATLRPAPDSLAWWLCEARLVPDGTGVTGEDLAWALDVRDALIHKVRENMGAPPDEGSAERLNAAAVETGLRPRFDDPRVVPSIDGVRGAIGQLIGVAFMAELDGTWHRFRTCADPTCVTVFYDHSKNHSAKWCSMQKCGNRSKVRAFRQRQVPAT